VRICKKQENLFSRDWYPVLELDAMDH
jgi:hypothetical protein